MRSSQRSSSTILPRASSIELLAPARSRHYSEMRFDWRRNPVPRPCQNLACSSHTGSALKSTSTGRPRCKPRWAVATPRCPWRASCSPNSLGSWFKHQQHRPLPAARQRHPLVQQVIEIAHAPLGSALVGVVQDQHRRVGLLPHFRLAAVAVERPLDLAHGAAAS